MALPAFFTRVADALRPVADVDAGALAAKLDTVRVRIELASSEPGAVEAFLLAVNLSARLYPTLQIISVLADGSPVPDATLPRSSSAAQTDPVARALALASAINPDIALIGTGNEYTRTAAPHLALLRIGHTQGQPPGQPPHAGRIDSDSDTMGMLPGSPVVVDAVDAAARIDAYAQRADESPNESSIDPLNAAQAPAHVNSPLTALSWLAAGALGVGELFRVVFASELGDRGRVAPQPGLFVLAEPDRTGAPDAVPAAADADVDADSAESVNVGTVHLAGAGAIGQAAVLALRAADVHGYLHVVDPETVTLTNLQRYVLTDAASVGASKVDLVADALEGTELAVTGENTTWHRAVAEAARAGGTPAQVVLTALDSAADRIAVAAGLPDRIYNAWTQVADLGWSRHEAFGIAPCLACLYYPERQRPSDDELVAQALDQPRLRILAYLTQNTAIGFPLVALPTIAEVTPPPGAERWMQVSLLEDLINRGVVPSANRVDWADKTVGELYRDGVCAGGLLPVGDLPGDVIVPLAHQSALAGILLATELILASDPALSRLRSSVTEHRYDVLRGLPQVLDRPRALTPNCICSDPDYLTAWAAKGTS